MSTKQHNRNLETQQFANEDELYKSIPQEGSLGLLALGYKGLLMWRKRRNELSSKGNSADEKK